MGMGKQKFPIEDRIAQDGCADVGVRGEGGQILVGNPSVSLIPCFSFVWRCWNCVGQTRQSTLKRRIKPSTRLVIDPLIQLNQPDNQPTKQDKYHLGLRPPMNMIIGGILCQIIRHFTRIRPISDRRARRVMPRSWCPSFTKDVFLLLTFTTLYTCEKSRSTNCYHLVYQRRHASCLSWGSYYYPWIGNPLLTN